MYLQLSKIHFQHYVKVILHTTFKPFNINQIIKKLVQNYQKYSKKIIPQKRTVRY